MHSQSLQRQTEVNAPADKKGGWRGLKGSVTKSAQYWIDRLGLIPHPEGGYYRETYRSALTIAREALPPQFTGPRLVSTAIYFLLDGEDFSAFHRLRSDELWHFYAGNSLLVHVIEENGRHSEISIGSNPEAGESLQAAVKAGSWFASSVRDSSSFALAGCTVAPGFDFEDFELGRRSDLIGLYPQHRRLIEQLTRS
jgi:predicted cupin superfamily sugar epimerase